MIIVNFSRGLNTLELYGSRKFYVFVWNLWKLISLCVIMFYKSLLLCPWKAYISVFKHFHVITMICLFYMYSLKNIILSEPSCFTQRYCQCFLWGFTFLVFRLRMVVKENGLAPCFSGSASRSVWPSLFIWSLNRRLLGLCIK